MRMMLILNPAQRRELILLAFDGDTLRTRLQHAGRLDLLLLRLQSGTVIHLSLLLELLTSY